MPKPRRQKGASAASLGLEGNGHQSVDPQTTLWKDAVRKFLAQLDVVKAEIQDWDNLAQCNRLDPILLEFMREHCPTCPMCKTKSLFEGFEFAPNMVLRYVWICVACSFALDRTCRFKWPNPHCDEYTYDDPAPTLKQLMFGPDPPSPVEDPMEQSLDTEPDDSGEEQEVFVEDRGPEPPPQLPITVAASGSTDNWTVQIQEVEQLTLPPGVTPAQNLLDIVLQCCSNSSPHDVPTQAPRSRPMSFQHTEPTQLFPSPERQAKQPGELQ